MNIKISKNAHMCAACGLDFQHGQSLTSTVRKYEGALHREDYCPACWDADRKQAAYSVWKVVYHDPKVDSEEPPEVFSPLRQLFYEAAEEESRIEMAKAFLAAGLLRRQKVFRLIKESDEAEGSVRITLYTDRIGNRLIEVPDPQFSYSELETARTRLVERLQELESAAESAEAGADADAPPAGAGGESKQAAGADQEQSLPETVSEVDPESTGAGVETDPAIESATEESNVAPEEAVHAEA